MPLVSLNNSTKDELCYMFGMKAQTWDADDLAKRIRNGCGPLDTAYIYEQFAEAMIFAKPNYSRVSGYHFTAAKWDNSGSVGEFCSTGESPLDACMRCYLLSLNVTSMDVPDLTHPYK